MKAFFKAVAGLLLLIISTNAFGQVYQTDTILYNGDAGKLINLVILGDGYQASEMAKFNTDAQQCTNAFLAQAPYSNYRNYFNVFAIRTPSAASGTKHPNTAPDCASASVPVSNPNTIFGSTFDAYGIHRLIVPMNTGGIMNVLASNFPNYDIVMILVNTTHYGGSGGQFATFTMHTAAGDLAIHEVGHSFAGLADEYWAGPQYAAEKPNMTQQNNTALVKWKNWLGFNNTGIYAYTGGTGWYKPHQNCTMEVLNSGFCSVCKETIVEKIHSLVNPVLSFLPSAANITAGSSPISLGLKLAKPLPNTLKIQWSLDNQPYQKNTDTISVNPALLSTGNHQVAVTVTDTTNLTRSNLHASTHIYSVVWNIARTISGVDITSYPYSAEAGVYPNPFSDKLTVTYGFDKTCEALVKITDLSGRLIYQSVPELKQPGTYTREFDQDFVAKLPSGVYLIDFIFNGSQVISKKIVKK